MLLERELHASSTFFLFTCWVWCNFNEVYKMSGRISLLHVPTHFDEHSLNAWCLEYNTLQKWFFTGVGIFVSISLGFICLNNFFLRVLFIVQHWVIFVKKIHVRRARSCWWGLECKLVCWLHVGWYRPHSRANGFIYLRRRLGSFGV